MNWLVRLFGKRKREKELEEELRNHRRSMLARFRILLAELSRMAARL